MRVFLKMFTSKYNNGNGNRLRLMEENQNISHAYGNPEARFDENSYFVVVNMGKICINMPFLFY